ncbi:hypothetical protein LTR16_000545 [Cryomyces antarcticus]|uniref:aldehyde dehydrogenase (NAD(+)) n=1 Tax=Cryomyces antarcticus TaxID=329879 RepID=A0ABR0KUJ2_9PEZI|nr:hypothetical protein LTR16_000545 [Cryomyces antarcticus]
MGLPLAVNEVENRLYINGEFVPSSDGKTFTVKSPYSYEAVATVYEATENDTNRAVAAAKAAFPAWSALDPHERGAYLSRLATLVRDSHTELATLDALCMGRPVSSYFDAHYSANIYDHYAQAGFDAKGQTSLNTKGHMNFTLRQPIGVVGAIIPWNVPVVLFAHKVAPALAAGCTIVLKSSEKAPLSSLKLASLIHAAGFPPGTVNVLSGFGNPSGSILSSHMDVRLINFTGSVATGRHVSAAAARSNLKKVILELGGKSPALIFEDADIEQASTETVMSMRLLSGQACIANSRIYVQKSVAPAFLAAFRAKFEDVKCGDPLDPATTQGPQADGIQFERINHYIALGNEAMGKTDAGAKQQQPPSTTNSHGNGNSKTSGFFIPPTIFTSVPESAPSMRDEIFGPVVHINTFATEAEAVQKANDTEFGLYASVYTRDLDRAMRVARALESGTVGINCTSPTIAGDMPFGGESLLLFFYSFFFYFFFFFFFYFFLYAV